MRRSNGKDRRPPDAGEPWNKRRLKNDNATHDRHNDTSQQEGQEEIEQMRLLQYGTVLAKPSKPSKLVHWINRPNHPNLCITMNPFAERLRRDPKRGTYSFLEVAPCPQPHYTQMDASHHALQYKLLTVLELACMICAAAAVIAVRARH
jgi:hypothetical protein